MQRHGRRTCHRRRHCDTDCNLARDWQTRLGGGHLGPLGQLGQWAAGSRRSVAEARSRRRDSSDRGGFGGSACQEHASAPASTCASRLTSHHRGLPNTALRAALLPLPSAAQHCSRVAAAAMTAQVRYWYGADARPSSQPASSFHPISMSMSIAGCTDTARHGTIPPTLVHIIPRPHPWPLRPLSVSVSSSSTPISSCGSPPTFTLGLAL